MSILLCPIETQVNETFHKQFTSKFQSKSADLLRHAEEFRPWIACCTKNKGQHADNACGRSHTYEPRYNSRTLETLARNRTPKKPAVPALSRRWAEVAPAHVVDMSDRCAVAHRTSIIFRVFCQSCHDAKSGRESHGCKVLRGTKVQNPRQTPRLSGHRSFTKLNARRGMNQQEWHLTAYDGSGEPVEVYYTIDSGEEAVQYHRGGHGTPASHASINVERFVFKGIDITDVVFLPRSAPTDSVNSNWKSKKTSKTASDWTSKTSWNNQELWKTDSQIIRTTIDHRLHP